VCAYALTWVSQVTTSLLMF